MDPATALSLPAHHSPRIAHLHRVRAEAEELGRLHPDYWPLALKRLRLFAEHVAGPASDEHVAHAAEQMRRHIVSDWLRLNWDWASMRHKRPAAFRPEPRTAIPTSKAAPEPARPRRTRGGWAPLPRVR